MITIWLGKFKYNLKFIVYIYIYFTLSCANLSFWNELNCFVIIKEKCSHVRSHHLFLESLTTNFTAVRCSSFEEIEENLCISDNTIGLMGGDITRHTPKPYGSFYLETNGESPYVIPDYRSFNRSLILYKATESQLNKLRTTKKPMWFVDSELMIHK